MDPFYNDILLPQKLWSRAEILSRPSPAPKQAGVYGWYFRTIAQGVPTADCHYYQDCALLYVGISPKKPAQNGRPASSYTLNQRLRQHLNGNAKGSTLRLTLGCLLQKELGIQLQRVGSGERMTFVQGEQRLNAWLDANAFVTWMLHKEPWLIEEELIRLLSLPLNLDQNQHHSFHATLSSLRSAARQRAQALPIANP